MRNTKQSIGRLTGIIFFLLIHTLPFFAQTPEGAMMLMNQGKYDKAIEKLEILEEFYPKKNKEVLMIARNCFEIQKRARAKYTSRLYADAIQLYNEILKLNPNDKDARQAIEECKKQIIQIEFDKCRSISEYEAFINKHPNSSLNENAKKRISELIKAETPQQEPMTHPPVKLSVDKNVLGFGSSGGTQTVHVDCNTNWSINQNNTTWFTATKSGNVLTIKCARAESQRQATVTINASDGTNKKTVSIIITQKGEVATTLSVDKNNLSFSSSEEEKAIAVYCNKKWSIEHETTSWCNVIISANKVIVRCRSNTESKMRTTHFVIKTTDGSKKKTIIIAQEGKPATTTESTQKTILLTVKAKDLTVGASSGTMQVYVTTNAESYEVFLLPSWCSVERMNRDSFLLSYEENPSTYERSDWFYVKAGDKKNIVRIKQSGRVSASTPQKKKASTNTSTARKTHFFVDAAYGFGTFTVTNSRSNQTLWTKEKAAEGSLSVGGFAGKENHVFLGVGFAFQSYLERSAKFGELFFDCRFVSSPEKKTHLFLDLRPGVVGPIGDPDASGITGFHLGAIGGFEFELSKRSTFNIGIRAGQTIFTNGNSNRCGIIAPAVGISF